MQRIWYKSFGIVGLSTFLLLTGCSSGSKTTTTSSPVASSAHGNVLNRGNEKEPDTLDPQKVEDVPGQNIIFDLFEGLTSESPDSSAPDAGIIPGVAQSWDISKDQKTYTFHLRHDAKWSNGQPVTADDFVYGIRRGIDPKTASTEAYLLYPIKNAQAINAGKMPVDSLGVSAPDPYTVQITLKQPTPYFLQIAANPMTYPAYKPSIDKWGDKFTQPGHLVSNGAYELKNWVVNDHITLVRNPNYWDNAHTSIDTVNYYPIVDTNTEIQMYRAGQLDYTYVVASDVFKEIKQQYPTELHVAPFAATSYLYVNTKKSALQNVKLRQALSMAIDRNAIAGSVWDFGTAPQYHVVPGGVAGVDTNKNVDWSTWPRDKQIAEAQKLYQEAGYSKEHPLKLTLLYSTNNDVKKLVIAIQAMWHDVLGVDLTLQNEEWKAFLSDMNRGNYDLVSQLWVGDYNHPFAFLSLMTCDSTQNSTGYCDPHYDQLLNQANAADTEQQRAALYDKASQVINHAYVLIPVVQYADAHLVKDYVGNYEEKQMLDHQHSKNWKIIQAK